MEFLKKEKIEVKNNYDEIEKYEQWNLEDIANKINEIIEFLNKVVK